MAADTYIDWHSAFYDAIQMELAQDWDQLDFEREHPLNAAPLRPDVIIIKKRPGAALHQKFAKNFRQHNIIEFKSPEDSLSVSDYLKTFSYPCIYQQEPNVSYTDVTLTLVRDAMPMKLLKFFRIELKRNVAETSPGIYVITGEAFPIQIIVGGQLPEAENIWLRNLNNDDINAQTLRMMNALKQSAGGRISTEAYFAVLIAAKQNSIKDVAGMATLAEVLEDVGLRQIWEAEAIKKGIERGIKKGIEQGIEQGISDTLSVMQKLKEAMPPERIAADLNISLETINRIKSTL